MACVAALVALVPGGLLVVSIEQLTDWRFHTARFSDDCSIAMLYVGDAVAGAWLALVFGRRWRPEAGWIDRGGRLLGAYWILCVILWCLFRIDDLLFLS